MRCVYSREAVAAPAREGCEADAEPAGAGAPLSCHGHGSSVTVTATFGMVAAGEVIAQLLQHAPTESAGAPLYFRPLQTGC